MNQCKNGNEIIKEHQEIIVIRIAVSRKRALKAGSILKFDNCLKILPVKLTSS